MPDWKTHLIFSLFLVVAWLSIFHFAGLYLSLHNITILVLVTIFSSIFPDVDMKRSKMRDVFSVIFAALVIALYLFFFAETWYYGFAYFILLYLILKYIPTKHRGITHSFKFSIIFSIVLASAYFIFNPFTVADYILWFVVVFSSYSMHLVVDRT